MPDPAAALDLRPAGSVRPPLDPPARCAGSRRRRRSPGRRRRRRPKPAEEAARQPKTRRAGARRSGRSGRASRADRDRKGIPLHLEAAPVVALRERRADRFRGEAAGGRARLVSRAPGLKDPITGRTQTFEFHRNRIGIQGNLFKHIEFEVERELTEKELTEKDIQAGVTPQVAVEGRQRQPHLHQERADPDRQVQDPVRSRPADRRDAQRLRLSIARRELSGAGARHRRAWCTGGSSSAV